MDAVQQQQPLKALSLAEILDRTFRIYRGNFLVCVGLTAVVSVPITIINIIILSSPDVYQFAPQLGLIPANLNHPDPGIVLLSLVIASLLLAPQVVLTDGPMSYIASESILGRKISIREAFQARQDRFARLGCGFVLVYMLLGGLTSVILHIAPRFLPALLTLVIPVCAGVVFYTSLVPVLTLENVSISRGINRAWGLGKARFWTGLRLILTIILIINIIAIAFNFVIRVAVSSALSSASPLTVNIVYSIFRGCVTLFLLPLMPIGLTLFYYDTRLRLEGLDIALEALDKPQARPSDVESPRLQIRLRGKDWRNMIVATVIIIAIALLGGLLSLSLLKFRTF